MSLFRVFFIVFLLPVRSSVLGSVVLSENIMQLALTSAELSNLVYNELPSSEGYENFTFYDEEPDQAIVATKDGHCYASFRGSIMSLSDWMQNFRWGMEEVCNSQVLSQKTCCSVRSGFYSAYYTSYYRDMENRIRQCATECKNPDDCVVLTGHSQGAGAAAVAALAMADLNPYVFAFGQPATLDDDSPCSLLSSERWFRFINTKTSYDGISYDPIPFAANFGAKHFGQMIILGEDPSSVAYIGLDTNDEFSPWDTSVNYDAHKLESVDAMHLGYLDRLKTLVESTDEYPVSAEGFGDSYPCSEDRECQSGVCGIEEGSSYSRCIGPENHTNNGILGSCRPCNDDSECASGRCISYHCTGSNELLDNGCSCRWDSECSSRRCDLFEAGECQAKLPLGASCDEDSDCLSDRCTWNFICEPKKSIGEICADSSECMSGKCNWLFTCTD